MHPNERRISLVLSGGGIRAIVFHMGVLKHLAEESALELVERISTVSGGSLLVGLLMKEAGGSWPTSQIYREQVYPRLRDKLCRRSLQWGALRQIRPSRLNLLLSRANLLALALQNEWGVTEAVSEMSSYPEWSINGTTAETGRRFRFKHDSVGDYSLGYAAPLKFPLAYALAVSAAFPGGFGPLAFDARKPFAWKKRPAWDAPLDDQVEVNIGYGVLHLYDGGVYDNLGLEPVFDAGRGSARHPDSFILLSDAGAPLTKGFNWGALSPFRLKRLADIMSEQSRALRVRSFMHFIGSNKERGAYVYIHAPSQPAPMINGSHPSAFPTSLRRVTHEEFDGLALHGYQCAGRVLGTDHRMSER